MLNRILSLRRGRTADLPTDDEEAYEVLLPLIISNQNKLAAELLSSPSCRFNVLHQFGRARKSLLHSAANAGAVECLSIILKRGADANCQDKSGNTALHMAARNGHRRCFVRLLEYKAHINISDNGGLSPLHWLAARGHTELLVLALDQFQAVVDPEDCKGQTPLHVACQNGHRSAAAKLLEHRASTERTDLRGWTPLFFACRYGQVECVRLLLKRGAQLQHDEENKTALNLCVEGGYVTCALVLVEYYPQLLVPLLKMVQSRSMEETKILLSLEYLCRKNRDFREKVVYGLAELTTGCGMELLGLSSSYDSLVNSFLRTIRVLVHLCDDFPVSPVDGGGGHHHHHHHHHHNHHHNHHHHRHMSVGGGGVFFKSGHHRRQGSSCQAADVAAALQQRAFAILEPLWQVMATWYVVLREELEQETDHSESVSVSTVDRIMSSTSVQSAAAAAAATASASASSAGSKRRFTMDSKPGKAAMSPLVAHPDPRARSRSRTLYRQDTDVPVPVAVAAASTPVAGAAPHRSAAAAAPPAALLPQLQENDAVDGGGGAGAQSLSYQRHQDVLHNPNARILAAAIVRSTPGAARKALLQGGNSMDSQWWRGLLQAPLRRKLARSPHIKKHEHWAGGLRPASFNEFALFEDEDSLSQSSCPVAAIPPMTTPATTTTAAATAAAAAASAPAAPGCRRLARQLSAPLRHNSTPAVGEHDGLVPRSQTWQDLSSSEHHNAAAAAASDSLRRHSLARCSPRIRLSLPESPEEHGTAAGAGGRGGDGSAAAAASVSTATTSLRSSSPSAAELSGSGVACTAGAGAAGAGSSAAPAGAAEACGGCGDQQHSRPRGDSSNSADGGSISSGSIATSYMTESLRDDQSTGSLVSAFADRLCAITQGYFLVCCAKEGIGPGGGVPATFLKFLAEHEVVMQVLLLRNPKLVFAHFGFLLESPDLLKNFIHIIHAQKFEDRRKWFYENLYRTRMPANDVMQVDNVIRVSRSGIFQSCCEVLMNMDTELLKQNFAVNFDGEEGMGAGVRREFFEMISAEMLNPDCALFTQSADGSTFQPNPNSPINPDHLSYFNFAGRVIGAAIYHQQLLNVYFTRSFYKHILGVSVNYNDVASIDPEYARNLQWILDNDISDLGLELTFSLETDVFGSMQVIELKPGGSTTPVLEENKHEYVQLVTEKRLTSGIQDQITAFLDGFTKLIPQRLVALFDEFELELLMSGLPDIDVQDWKKHTLYAGGYDENTELIKWFWEVVSSFDRKECILLLQFSTGSSRVPHGGFANLSGSHDTQNFCIARIDFSGTPTSLPTASTCFNMLKLPQYPSKEVLYDRLSVALHYGSQGFEFV